MGEISSEFREECLRIHNEYRAVHDSPALALDKKLNEFAQTRATLFAEGDYVSLGESIPYGENVYMRRTTDPDFKISAEEAVQAWLMRRKYHVFGEPQPTNLSVVKKFTQLVWKSTKKLGVGMVTSSNGTIYVVCNYDPAGNEEYQFADNVLPAKEEDEAEVETPETVELLSVEPQEEVVESLDRLYAVPSEKLRVWTVWLCKIGDEAGEWYKWIHVHTDLIVRMADILRTIEEEDEKKAEAEAAEEQRAKSKDSGDRRSKLSKISEERRSKTRVSERGSVRSKSKESASRAKSKESAGSSEEKFYDARTSSTIDKDTQSEAASVEQKKSTVSQRSKDGTDKQDELEEAKSSEDGTEKPEKSVASKPSEAGSEVEDSADIFARDSEQAEQETPVEKSESKASRVASKASAKDSKAEEPVSEEDKLPVGVKWKPLGEPEEEEEEEEEIELLEIPTCREEMMLYKKDFMHQATIYISLYEHWKETAAQAIKELMGRQVMPTSVVHEIDVNALLKKNEAKKEKKFTPPEDMEAFIRDMARAEQDIPYIFYLKVEPNIDIAIEFGAEELYELPRREHIYGDYKCLYFNLIDKPGTLDEPESLINKPIEEENKDETD